MQESGGSNPYAYGGNDPVNVVSKSSKLNGSVRVSDDGIVVQKSVTEPIMLSASISGSDFTRLDTNKDKIINAWDLVEAKRSILNGKADTNAMLKLMIDIKVYILTTFDPPPVEITKMSIEGKKLLMEIELDTRHLVYTNKVLTGIKIVDIGDGGLTVGFGIYFPYSTPSKKNEFEKKYGISIVKNNVVSIDLASRMFEDVIGSYEKTVVNFAKDNNITLNQHQFDALVMQAFNGWAYGEYGNPYIRQNQSAEQIINEVMKVYKARNSNYTNYEKGWRNRVTDQVNVYLYGIYKKTY